MGFSSHRKKVKKFNNTKPLYTLLDICGNLGASTYYDILYICFLKVIFTSIFQTY